MILQLFSWFLQKISSVAQTSQNAKSSNFLTTYLLESRGQLIA